MNYIHARRFKRSKLVFSVFRKSGFYPAFTLDTEARGLLPFYAILVQLDTFTVLRQNALTFTLSPPYVCLWLCAGPPGLKPGNESVRGSEGRHLIRMACRCTR
jgi:hypothetical protein